ncbi:MBOAT family O-acyltransferase [Meridianimarinicoccus aquatilis]|nr:MBOAT family O-acyltransferase [Fluviibacterium aquatile]
MLFHTFEYAILLCIVFLSYLLLPKWTRWIVLVSASYIFYATSQFGLVWLLLVSGAVDYLCGLFLFQAKGKAVRVGLLTTSVIINIFLLGYFKYRILLQDGFDYLTSGGFATTADQFILPIGISFFTLQSMGYTIDVYRGKQVPERHPGYFFLYVAYFPQLIAGPIERARDLLPQLHSQRPFDWTRFRSGCLLILFGLMKKLVIVAGLTPFFADVYQDDPSGKPISLLIAVSLSIFYIYADFSGYTDLARGSSRIIGIELSKNFRSPMTATSIRDFWQRWHITLTKWIFDYLHTPLASLITSRTGRYVLIVFTFLIVGLWHGANITFILFGFLHGLTIVIETLCARNGWTLPSGQLWQAARIVRTFSLSAIFGALFLSPSVPHALAVYGELFQVSFHDIFATEVKHKAELFTAFLGTLVWMGHRLKPTLLDELPKSTFWRWALYIGLLLFVILFSTSNGEDNAFIYFQF